jgi:Arc/MetJ-type ribon-helix-helix transcriptional regulator
MKITVSIPESLSEEVKSVAKDLGVSPSKLIRTAVQDFLRRRRDEEVTAALNRSWVAHPDEVDPFLQYLVYEAMKRTEWRE